MQLVSIQLAILEALYGCRKLQVVTGSETLFVLASVVFPPEKALVVESWPLCNPVGVGERAQSILTSFPHCLKGLPDVEVMPMPYWDTNGSVITLKLKKGTSAYAKQDKRRLSDSFVQKPVEMLSEFAENFLRGRTVKTSHAESLVAKKGRQEAKFGPGQIRTGLPRTDALQRFSAGQSNESAGPRVEVSGEIRAAEAHEAV